MSDTGRIGCSSWCFMDQALPDALESLSQYTKRVEILADGPHDIIQYEEACYSYDFRYSIHAPCSDINIACENEHMRKAAIAALSSVSAVCDRICAEKLVIHPGFIHSGEMRSRASAALCRSLGDLAALQEERDVRLTIENMGFWDICFFRNPPFLQILDEYGLGFTLDVGHAYVNGHLEKFLEQGSPVHIHLHDNHGSKDEHLACGDGTIDFMEVFQSVPPDATLVVETPGIDAYMRSVAYIRELCL